MKEEIKKIYLALGRDPNKLLLDNKSEEQLEDILKKLKAIKYSFDLLFSPDPGVELAKEMIKNTFKIKDGRYK